MGPEVEHLYGCRLVRPLFDPGQAARAASEATTKEEVGALLRSQLEVVVCSRLPLPNQPSRLTIGHAQAINGAIFGLCHARRVSDSGRFVEWHVVLGKSFQDIAFEFVPGLHHSIVFLLPAFSLARFETIRAVSNAVSCDGVD